MALRTKLLIANVLMVVGCIPLAFCVTSVGGVLFGTPGRPSLIPVVDPIGMIGLAILSFLIACALAGIAAAWSWDLARQHPDARSRTAAGFRLMTAVVLASPFLLVPLARLLDR